MYNEMTQVKVSVSMFCFSVRVSLASWRIFISCGAFCSFFAFAWIWPSTQHFFTLHVLTLNEPQAGVVFFRH